MHYECVCMYVHTLCIENWVTETVEHLCPQPLRNGVRVQ